MRCLIFFLVGLCIAGSTIESANAVDNPVHFEVNETKVLLDIDREAFAGFCKAHGTQSTSEPVVESIECKNHDLQTIVMCERESPGSRVSICKNGDGRVLDACYIGGSVGICAGTLRKVGARIQNW